MVDTGEVPRAADSRPGVPPLPWRGVLSVAAVVGVAHLVVATRFGWHRDEFYYVVTGQHLAWGYVDQPVLTPLLARLAAELPGGVLPLRVLAILAQLAVTVLAARLAGEFGGGRKAQILAAAAVAVCPLPIFTSMFFGTTITDLLVWAALFVAVARALRLRTTGAWLVAGVLAAIGLLNKETVLGLLLGIVVALVLSHRDVLRTPGPWLAGGLAVLGALPYALWNAVNGWPTLTMAGVLAQRQGGMLAVLAHIPEILLVLAGPPLIALWVIGVRWLCSRAGRDHRWALVVAIVVVVLFTVTEGKVYYAAPVLLPLFAAGAVRVAALRPKVHWSWPVLIALCGVLAIAYGYAVFPLPVENKLANPTVLETYGWPDVAAQVTAVAATMPPGTVILTGNYGEAGALDILGPADGLRLPVVSGQNADSFFGLPPGTPDTVLCVGEFSLAYLHRFWSQVTEIAPLKEAGEPNNEEITKKAAIYLCQQPRGNWARLWPGLRHFD